MNHIRISTVATLAACSSCLICPCLEPTASFGASCSFKALHVSFVSGCFWGRSSGLQKQGVVSKHGTHWNPKIQSVSIIFPCASLSLFYSIHPSSEKNLAASSWANGADKLMDGLDETHRNLGPEQELHLPHPVSVVGCRAEDEHHQCRVSSTSL